MYKKLCKKWRKKLIVSSVTLISAALLAQSAQGMNQQKEYRPRTQEEKELAKENAKKITKQLISEFKKNIPAMEFFADNKQESKKICGTLETIDKINNYSWKLEYSRLSASSIDFTIFINKNGMTCGNIYGELSKNGITDKLKLYIASLSVTEPNRQQGFGEALLATIIELATYFKKKTKISLIAEPEKEAMRPVLMKYYKEFGFSVHKKKIKWLKLYIDNNGTIIKPDAMDAYISTLRNNRKTQYSNGAKKIAQELYNTVKLTENTNNLLIKSFKTVIGNVKPVTGMVRKVLDGEYRLKLTVGDKYTKQIDFLIASDKKNTNLKLLAEALNYQPYDEKCVEKIINFIAIAALHELGNLFKSEKTTVACIPIYWTIFGQNWGTNMGINITTPAI